VVWQGWNYRQQDDTDILGRDPAGPLAPLGGTESLLHCTDPSGTEDLKPEWWSGPDSRTLIDPSLNIHFE